MIWQQFHDFLTYFPKTYIIRQLTNNPRNIKLQLKIIREFT